MAFDNIFDQNRRIRDAIASPANQRAKDMSQARGEFRAEGKLFTDFPNRTAYDQALYDRTQSIASARNAPINNTPPPTVGAGPIVIPESAFSGANAAADRRFNTPLFNNPQQPLATPARTPFSMSQQQPFGNAQLPYNSLFPLGSSPDIGSSGFSREIKPSTPFAPAGPTINTTQQILSPYGFASTNLTPQQVQQRDQSRQQAEQMGTMPRTPEQQQALLDNIRKNAPALNQQRTDWVQDTIQQRRENPTTYKSPNGKSVAVPTNRFGEPIKAWMDQLGDSGRLNYGPKPAPKTASAASPQPIRGARFENLNSFNPSESFTGSMASNYAPPTTLGFGNRTRISGEKRNSSPMSEGIMSAFDSGISVVPSYAPSFPTGFPPNNALAMGINQSAFGSGFSAIF
jgi:hypothetical protein